MRYWLDRVVRHYGEDIFPTGLNPHYLRHIVATDLGVRFGLRCGLELAVRALRNSSMTIRDSYVVMGGLPEEGDFQGGATRERAIREAAREAAREPRLGRGRMSRRRRARPKAP